MASRLLVAQAAQPDHGGGFYYYLDDAFAIDATKRGDTFAKSVAAGKTLVLCEVEIRGREIEYGNGKRGGVAAARN
jgi:hypothetical protein